MAETDKRVSEHFPPNVREALRAAAALPSVQDRQERIQQVHKAAVAAYPEMFKEGA